MPDGWPNDAGAFGEFVLNVCDRELTREHNWRVESTEYDEEVWELVKAYKLSKGKASQLEQAEANPKVKMAMIFKWYFNHTMELAFEGDLSKKVNFQVHTGPALGAFNQWVKNTSLASSRNRHVDEIGIKIMDGAATLMKERLSNIDFLKLLM